MPERNTQPTVDPARNPLLFKLLPNSFYCDECDECLLEDGHIRYCASTRGSEWGSFYIGSNGHTETDCHDSDTGETDDYEYNCEECEVDATRRVRMLENFMSWIRANVLENNERRIEDTRTIRGFGGMAVVSTTTMEQPGPPPQTETYMRAPMIWQEYRDPTTNDYIGKGFHEEILPYLKEAAQRGDIEMFNWQHPVYQTVQTEPTVVEPTTPSPIEDEEPESHNHFSETHHERWWKYCTLPNGIVTCPKETCHYPFVVERAELADDLICPRCQTEFNPTTEDDISGNNTMRFRATTVRLPEGFGIVNNDNAGF